jgi:hypothetical protein
MLGTLVLPHLQSSLQAVLNGNISMKSSNFPIVGFYSFIEHIIKTYSNTQIHSNIITYSQLIIHLYSQFKDSKNNTGIVRLEEITCRLNSSRSYISSSKSLQDLKLYLKNLETLYPYHSYQITE